MPKRKSKSRKHATRSKPKSYLRGTFMATNQRYGFVRTKDEEFFIPASKCRDAMDGDIVEIATSDPRGSKRGKYLKDKDAAAPGSKRMEGRIVRVVERRHSEVIGRFEVAPPFGVVIPDDPRIKHDVFTRLSDSPDIKDGSTVRVKILDYPTKRSAATGKIVEVFTVADSSELQVEKIMARYNLPSAFPDDVLAQADEKKLDVKGALEGGYRDIRERFTLTIDPADAKDFDDALSIEETTPGEFRLGVHIADVSAYVPWGDAIDLEARKRATSRYLADRVIPMLPPKLSEELCSLRPEEDRLCMTCDLYIDEHANLLDCDFYPAIMRSDLRLTYDQAQEKIDSKDADDVAKMLRLLSHLAKERQRNREAFGGIEFNTEEAKVVLDKEGKPLDIKIRQKTDATKLVEEAMIFANEAVATYLYDNERPCAYRDHEHPSTDALSALVPVFQEFKWFTNEMAAELEVGNPHMISHILETVKGRIEEQMVTMMLLRAMMRAVYSPENEGHYGLGLKAYCHFTSPIRRYPDLIVHRMLKAAIGFKQKGMKGQIDALAHLCEHSSEMERNAEAASFDSQKQKMVEYMEPKIGESFDAVISGVVSYGLYVRLENCVEGLVPVRTIGSEYFVFNEARHELRGSETNTVYRLGMPVHVKLQSADVALSRLDFVLD